MLEALKSHLFDRLDGNKKLFSNSYLVFFYRSSSLLSDFCFWDYEIITKIYGCESTISKFSYYQSNVFLDVVFIESKTLGESASTNKNITIHN